MFESKVADALSGIKDALWSCAKQLEDMNYRQQNARDGARAQYEQVSMICETIERGFERIADALEALKEGDDGDDPAR